MSLEEKVKKIEEDLQNLRENFDGAVYEDLGDGYQTNRIHVLKKKVDEIFKAIHGIEPSEVDTIKQEVGGEKTLIKKKCQLMENALNNPNWDSEINTKLCIGDCKKCPHFVVDKNNKLWKIINALCDHFEEKRLREAKLEFMTYILDKALEKTNQELEESNLLDFMKLLQKKDHYQEEFKEAIFLFEKNFREYMEKITYEVIEGIKEV